MTDHNPLAPIKALADDAPSECMRGGCDPACAPPCHLIDIDDLRAALAEAREAVDGLVAERDRLREALMFEQTPRVRIIDDLLDALGLDDSVTEDEARERLDGCDCNGEEGTRHLVWHLVQQRDRLRETLGRVEALATQPNDQVECPYDDVREEAMWRVGHVAAMHSILTALVQPATDEEAGQ